MTLDKVINEKSFASYPTIIYTRIDGSSVITSTMSPIFWCSFLHTRMMVIEKQTDGLHLARVCVHEREAEFQRMQ